MAGSYLLTVRDYGDRSLGDDLYPMLDDDGHAILEDGEQLLLPVLWANLRCVSFVGGQAHAEWPSLPSAAAILVTDRRLVYVCERFTKGSKWLGLGLGGAAIAGAAMVVSAAPARNAREGRAATGQFRYEWLAIATWNFPANKPASAQLVVSSPGAPLCLDLTFTPISPITQDTARYVSALAARHRLAHCGDLPAAAKLTAVAQQADDGIAGPGAFKVALPGSILLPNRLPMPGTTIAVTSPNPVAPTVSEPVGIAAQWAADPYRRHELRYYDGAEWTGHVSDGGQPSTDPITYDGLHSQA